MKDFNGKVVLITGGSSGIGLATAEKLAALGAHVWLLARDPQKLKDAQALVQKRRASPDQTVGILSVDVTQKDEVIPCLEHWMDENGVPDLLINSAGFTYPAMFEDLSLDNFQYLMDINYFGTVFVCKAVVPRMIKRRSGCLVNIASMAAVVPIPGYSGYAASKFAVIGLTENLRMELQQHNIQVALVYPPDTKTAQLEFEDKLKPPLTKALNPIAGEPINADKVADAILNGIRKNHLFITVGFMNWLETRLVGIIGSLVFPIFDLIIAYYKRSIAESKA